MRTSLVGTLAALLISGVAAAQQPVPRGEQFQVNSYTTDAQIGAAIAVDAQGGFVVVWDSYGSTASDTSASSIQAQLYNSSGSPRGGQFQVNSYTTSYQDEAAVAVDAQGNFVVVWQSDGSYGTDADGSIQAQRYAANGAPLGGQIQVNTFTTGDQRRPAVAVREAGDFVVVWQSTGSPGSDSSGSSIQGQLFNADGAPLGGQFQINSYTTSNQSRPAVDGDGLSNFVVVWESSGSSGSDTDGGSIQAQRFDSTGAAVGGQFQVNSYTTNSQAFSSAGMSDQGDLVVVWASDGSYGTDLSDISIQAQRYDSSGAAVGEQFQVNSYTTNGQYPPHVASGSDGEFIVVWQSRGSPGNDSAEFSVVGRFFDAVGTPQGEDFQVNSYTTGSQFNPVAGIDHGGNFVVSWASDGSYGTDTDYWSIQAQRYAQPTVFIDGFESGDTSAWSGTTP